MSSYLFKTAQIKKYQDFLQRLTKSSHAIILKSDDQLLLDIIAKLLVMKLECSDKLPCFVCPSCQKILDNNAIDIEYFGDEKQIVVEDSEKIVEDSYILPLECEHKYFILKNFDKATIQAQNKLLKVIEEPQKFDKFILLSTNIDAVLSTVKSRCEIYDVPRFSDEELKGILDFSVGDGKKVNLGAEYANGNLTKLSLVYSDDDFASVYDLCKKIVVEMQNSGKVLDFSSKIIKYKGKIDMFLQILMSIYRDILAIKLGKQNLVQNKDYINGLLVIANSISVLATINIIKEIQSTPQKLQSNANINGVVDGLLLKILEIKHICK